MKPQAEHLPKPTYWPFFFAIGTTLIAWGLITSWIVSGVGAVMLFVSTLGWIKDVSE
jgi:hypothetical protein